MTFSMMSSILLDREKTKVRWPSAFRLSSSSTRNVIFPDSAISCSTGNWWILFTAGCSPTWSDSPSSFAYLEEHIKQNKRVEFAKKLAPMLQTNRWSDEKKQWKQTTRAKLWITKGWDNYFSSMSRSNLWHCLFDSRRGWSQIFFRTVSATKGDFVVLRSWKQTQTKNFVRAGKAVNCLIRPGLQIRFIQCTNLPNFLWSCKLLINPLLILRQKRPTNKVILPCKWWHAEKEVLISVKTVECSGKRGGGRRYRRTSAASPVRPE